MLLLEVFLKFVASTSEENEKQTAAAEESSACHIVRHNFSFRSNDCIPKLTYSCKIYDQKYWCVQTTCEAVKCNIIIAFSLENVNEESEKAQFIRLCTDTSNRNPVINFSNLVHCFSSRK